MDWADKIAQECTADVAGSADERRRISEALRVERERCAQVCESLIIPGHSVQEPSMRAAIDMIREPHYE